MAMLGDDIEKLTYEELKPSWWYFIINLCGFEYLPNYQTFENEYMYLPTSPRDLNVTESQYFNGA